MATSSLINSRGVREAYDYRVALPLAIVAASCLVFVAVNGHKNISLSNASSKTPLSKTTPAQSTIPVSEVQTLPTLSKYVPTEDMNQTTSPATITTDSPQSAGTSADETTKTNPQTTASSSPTTTPEDSIPSVTEVNNAINGALNSTTKVVTSTTKGVLTLL